MSHMIKGDLGVNPGEVLLCAFESIVDYIDCQPIAQVVDALVELA